MLQIYCGAPYLAAAGFVLAGFIAAFSNVISTFSSAGLLAGSERPADPLEHPTAKTTLKRRNNGSHFMLRNPPRWT